MTLVEAKEILKAGGVAAHDYQSTKMGYFQTLVWCKDHGSLPVSVSAEALAVYRADQRANGWQDMPEKYRIDAINLTLHLNHKLKIDFKRSVVYQAYYTSLNGDERLEARRRNNFTPCL